MADYYSDETAGKLAAGKRHQIEPTAYGMNSNRMRATVQYDGQAIGQTISLGELPPGAVFAFGIITASATMGAAATLAIGVAGSPAKFRAAAVHTTADTPTLFGKAAAAKDDPLEKNTEVLATVGAAAMPNSAEYMVIDIYYTSVAS